MKRFAVCASLVLAPACSDGAQPSSDAGNDVVALDSSANDASDSATDGGVVDSSCGVPADASVKTVDATSPLTIFDVGVADLRLDLTSDGATALIEDAATGDLFFYDTAKGTITKVAHLDGDTTTVGATSISGNGQRIGAFHGATDIVGGVWSECTNAWGDLANTNTTGCAGPPNNQSGVFGLSSTGNVAVGLVWNQCTAAAMRWTESGDKWTPAPLDHLGIKNGSNRASVVSDDGSVIGGFAQRANADRSPAVWKSDGTGTLLDPSGDVVGEVLSISADGTMVAGQWNTADDAGTPNNSGFYWTSKDGVVLMGPLPSPQTQDMVWLTAIAANDKLILGSAGDPSWAFDLDGSEERAIVWTKAAGTRPLQDIVTAQNIAIPAGYDLTGIMAASADGTVVLGFATDMNDPNLAQHTFVLRMPVSAYGL